MKTDMTFPRPRPARVTGARHLIAATGYSIGGLRRLWSETAFRHIAMALPVCGGLLWALDAGPVDYIVLLILFSVLVAVEALNTAIECIVDHLAPQWQVFARDAKDLGSLATMCLILANVMFLCAVALRFYGAS